MYNAIRIIPVLLLSEDGLVKTIKFKNPRYIGDPINTVRIFNEKEVDELVILDIGASARNFIDYELIKSMVSEAFMPISYGGGVKNLEQIKLLIRQGIEKIIVNSAAFGNGQFIKQAVEIFGKQAIVGCIDVKKGLLGGYSIYTKNATEKLDVKLEDHICKLVNLGVGEIIINDISRDGLMQGYDIALIKQVTNIVDIPVTICGGAGKFEHLLEAKDKTHISGLAAGSMFIYQGKHNAVLINYLNHNQLREFVRN